LVAVLPAAAAHDAVGAARVGLRRGPLHHTAEQVVHPLRAVALRKAADFARQVALALAGPTDLVADVFVAPRVRALLGGAARGPLPLFGRGKPLVLRCAVLLGLREVDADHRQLAAAILPGGRRIADGRVAVVTLAGFYARGVEVRRHLVGVDAE